jgi:GR25 family glycosyltransferase involved in LPS biosynthesis
MKRSIFILVALFITVVIYIVYSGYITHLDPFITDTSATNSVDDLQIRVFAINLDKDTTRFNQLYVAYDKSDMSSKYPLHRFSAVVGKQMNIHEWLTPNSVEQLNTVEHRGFRTHHYQLTRGAIGCFLSHYYLAKQLLSEPAHIKAYLVLEDDAELKPNSLELMTKLLMFAPNDWELIPFHYHRFDGPDVNKFYKKCRGFWGTGTYLLNRQGAMKIVNEFDETKMDGQLDAYLSRMAQQNKLNIYGCQLHIAHNGATDTNIQMEIRDIPGVDPFNYNGYIV